MPRGFMDTKNIDLPSNIDHAYIEGLKTASGTTFARVLQEIDSRLTTFNGGLDPLLASLIYPTDEVFAERMQPIAFDVDESAEYTLPRAQFTDSIASSLPLRKWDVATGWTEEGLEEMSFNKIMLQVDSILLGLKTRHRKEVLKRLFSDAEVRIDPKTTSTNPGFAGSGTGLNVFNLPTPDGNALPDNYTLYFRDTEANLATALRAMRAELAKWQSGPFDLIGPQSLIDAITALPEFLKTGSQYRNEGMGVATANVDPNTYIGTLFDDVLVRPALNDFTAPNLAMFKTYGALSPQNPLAHRFDSRPGRGRDAFLRSRSLFPLSEAVVIQRYGIGVANRTGAALLRVGESGGYVAPAI